MRDGDTKIQIFNFMTETLEFSLAVEPDAQISCNSEFVITHCCIPNGTALVMFSKVKKTAEAIHLIGVQGIDALFAFERSVLYKAKNGGLITLNLVDHSQKNVANSLR